MILLLYLGCSLFVNSKGRIDCSQALRIVHGAPNQLIEEKIPEKKTKETR
jgi:hypothetical protein